MQGASLAELRDLSLRSRRAQRRGLLSILAVMLAVPLEIVVSRFVGAWGPVLVLVTGGIAFVLYAHAAGEERGAFRRVFRRISEERRTRTIVPEGPPAPLVETIS